MYNRLFRIILQQLVVCNVLVYYVVNVVVMITELNNRTTELDAD